MQTKLIKKKPLSFNEYIKNKRLKNKNGDNNERKGNNKKNK